MLIKSASSISQFWLKFDNPLHILVKRHFLKNGMIQVVDRKTKIRCKCTLGSSRMFGETWHDKDYNIPHFTIKKDDIVVDIGANQGFFTCYSAFKGAKVYAFEPCRDSFKTLIENLKTNKLDSRVVAKQWAIEEQNGFVELMSSNRLGGGMNTTNTKFANDLELNILKRDKVPCFSLPHIIEYFSIDKIRLCKLDCEGAELNILKQLKPEHLNKIDSFVLEYHPQAYSLNELIELLLSWGTHQVSFAEDKSYCSREIIRVVKNTELTTLV